MTFKQRLSALSRQEHEFPIPVIDAREILASMCEGGAVAKIRYVIPFAGMNWELDIFSGTNAGLLIAELELEDELQDFELPSWVGAEVTDDLRYTNSSLALHPFTTW
jgi:adenylate cyclase